MKPFPRVRESKKRAISLELLRGPCSVGSAYKAVKMDEKGLDINHETPSRKLSALV